MRDYLTNYERPLDSLDRRRLASWRHHGIDITIEEFDRRVMDQGGRCAICRALPSGRRLIVDHDHETGAVRGLLCDYCNRRLLIPRNTPEVLMNAVRYLTANAVVANTPATPAA